MKSYVHTYVQHMCYMHDTHHRTHVHATHIWHELDYIKQYAQKERNMPNSMITVGLGEFTFYFLKYIYIFKFSVKSTY